MHLYATKTVQQRTRKCAKSVAKRVNREEAQHDRNGFERFVMPLLRLCYDKIGRIFKIICIFSVKMPRKPLTYVRFCDTLVTQELRM